MFRLLSSLADFMFPRTCMVCGRELMASETDLCMICRADIPLTRYFGMKRNPMADVFNARIQETVEESGRCEAYAFATALFHYSSESGYASITRELKYGRALGEGRRFARILGNELASSPLFKDVDLIVPVPLHRRRLWERGYNQAEVIASEICSCLPGARLEKRLLERVRKTRSQATLHSHERAGNVRGAFRVREACAGVAQTSGSSPRHILIVDDVFTTGATIAECHRALREVFDPQVRISAATLGVAGLE